MKKFLIVVPLIALMSGCAMKYNTGVEIDGPGKRIFGNEVNYPSWYTETPKTDDKAIYSVASEFSTDFQFSVDKTMLSAKRELASNFSSYVDGMMKDFMTEIGSVDDATISDINRTSKMIIARVNLIGVQRTQFKVVHERNGYRSFVQLRYATDESNRLLLNEIKKNRRLNAKLQASESFRELEESVKNVERQ
jgi:hypothetical protein